MLNALDDRLQRSPGDVLHVHQPQLSLGKDPLVVDADNVIVIKLGQRLGLGASFRRDFESDEPLHRSLARQKNLGERAAPQFHEQIEIFNRVFDGDRFEPPPLAAAVKRR